MRTISQVVRDIILKSPYLTTVIADGIGNNAQIAKQIKKEVQDTLLEKISNASISMSLHRLSKDLKRPKEGSTFITKISDITVRSNLVSYIFKNSSESLSIESSLLNKAYKAGSFLNISRGLSECLVLIEHSMQNEIEKTIKNKIEYQKTLGLSAITMTLPEESLSVPGVYFPILQALAFAGINFVEITSVSTEFTIIFEDKDIDQAFSVLKKITTGK